MIFRTIEDVSKALPPTPILVPKEGVTKLDVRVLGAGVYFRKVCVGVFLGRRRFYWIACCSCNFHRWARLNYCEFSRRISRMISSTSASRDAAARAVALASVLLNSGVFICWFCSRARLVSMR